MGLVLHINGLRLKCSTSPATKENKTNVMILENIRWTAVISFSSIS